MRRAVVSRDIRENMSFSTCPTLLKVITRVYLKLLRRLVEHPETIYATGKIFMRRVGTRIDLRDWDSFFISTPLRLGFISVGNVCGVV